MTKKKEVNRLKKQKFDSENVNEQEKRSLLQQERLERIKQRRKLIKKGNPEINYHAFKNQTRTVYKSYIFSFVVGAGCALVTNIWLGLIVCVVSFFIAAILLAASKKKLELIFGEEICKKYNYDWHKLYMEYKDDM